MKKLLEHIIGQNGRFMKYIVVYCLFYSSVMILLCYIGRWFGVDTDTVLTVTAGIFGANLISTLIIKITENKADKKSAERKEDPNEKKTV